jgi:hypothetical protein
MENYASTPHTTAISESKESFQTWVNRPYIGAALREQIQKANALIIPTEGYADRDDVVFFPVGTEELFRFLRSSKHENLEIDICSEDADYRELARHSELLIIASFLVTAIVAPVVADLIADFIKRRLGSREKESTVKSEIIIQDEQTERSIRISYEGPASDYRETMAKAILNLKSTPLSPVLPPKEDSLQLPPPKQPNRTEKRNKKRKKHSRK